MASALHMSNAAVNAEADALARLLDAGFIKLYTGTQPATADTALSGNTLLGTLGVNATSAPAASAGVLTFNAVSSDTTADNTGTATFYRALKSDATSVVMDGSVGTSGADMNINAVAIVAGAQIDITSWTHTVPKT